MHTIQLHYAKTTGVMLKQIVATVDNNSIIKKKLYFSCGPALLGSKTGLSVGGREGSGRALLVVLGLLGTVVLALALVLVIPATIVVLCTAVLIDDDDLSVLDDGCTVLTVLVLVVAVLVLVVAVLAAPSSSLIPGIISGTVSRDGFSGP